jgi:hypothetical protein
MVADDIDGSWLGLMLVPALIPLCLSDTSAREIAASGSMAMALAAVGVHTAAMLAVTGVIAVVACRGINPRWRGRNATAPAPANEGNPHANFNSHRSGLRICVAGLFRQSQDCRTPKQACGARTMRCLFASRMRECLEKESRASNAALKQAEEQAAAAISKWDEDARLIDLAKKKLRASNKAFEQYRDAQCAFAYSLGGGAIGNALEMRRLACRIELDMERIKQLNADMSALSAT